MLFAVEWDKIALLIIACIGGLICSIRIVRDIILAILYPPDRIELSDTQKSDLRWMEQHEDESWKWGQPPFQCHFNKKKDLPGSEVSGGGGCRSEFLS